MPRTKAFDENKVLDKATALFWKKGFHATSIQDLVDHLGINRASIYGTFGDKQKLFDKAFQSYLTRTSESQIKFLEQENSVKEGLYNLFEKTISDSCSDSGSRGCFIVNSSTELCSSNPELKTQVSIYKGKMEKVILSFLETGVQKGEFDKGKDLRSIATMLYTLHNGLMVISKVNRDKRKMLASIKTALSVLD